MREQSSICAIVHSIALAFAIAALTPGSPSAYAQAAPPDAATAATLASDVNALVTQLAEQRDAMGGWPAAVQANYDSLAQLATQLSTAAAAGDVRLVQRRHRACMRLAKRISRWLINRNEANEQPPARENRDAIVARLVDRLAFVSGIAARAGVALDLTAANAARQQLESVRANGTDAQLRAALRALRDEIDTLQDAIPDPTN